MAYTVQYETTGQTGTRIHRVTNWYGNFSTLAEAQAYLLRARIPGAVIVERNS